MTQDTPMMTQYKKIKAAHEGFLLFYRMGDFYELFGDDAVTASAVLGITLTKRRSAKDGDEGIPMCGVPHHAAEGYISTLIESGYKIALCDQTETPEEAKARGGYKALVKREVVRMFTGGTLTEEGLLTAGANNFVAAVSLHNEQGEEKATLAWGDISTGEMSVQTMSFDVLSGELLRLNAAEVLVNDENSRKLEAFWPLKKMTINDALFTEQGAAEDLQKSYEIDALSVLGFENKYQTLTTGALMGYIRLTQVGKMPTMQRPLVIRAGGHVILDAATRRNLEISTTLRGAKRGSLLSAVDETVTGAGGRLLSTWINAPLTQADKIQARLDGVQFFMENAAVRDSVREALKQTADIARAVSRLSLGRGGPRDVAAIRATLQVLPMLQGILQTAEQRTCYEGLLSQALGKIDGLESISAYLATVLKQGDLPLLARDGGFVAAGYCDALEQQRNLQQNGNALLQALEQEESTTFGAPLKLKYNKVWGRFFEITKVQIDKAGGLPEHFIHRQTTTSSQRFSTAKLMELEQSLSAADAKVLEREQEIFQEMVQQIVKSATPLLKAAESLALIDVLAAGAALASKRQYVRPMLDNSNTFIIEGGRHPVVERALNKAGENFMPNDTTLTNHQLWLVTGPNMAGKSTFLRQNALITLLAQAGYFVPATKAHIGVVDKIFCRIGASDDLAEGQSTFMVEMVETAHILSHATDKSLVVLDEIGRGTATYDGLSIAWACAEHLVTVCKARGLFATHYHELTTLAETFAEVSNHHVAVKEWQGNVIFLHEVKAGAASGSYGIHVAKLAGVPTSVLKRATELLKNLEASTSADVAADMPLFTTPQETPKQTVSPETVKRNEIEGKLVSIDLDELSPREAQNLLYDLKIMAAMGKASS